MDNLVSQFKDFLQLEKQYSPHTVKAYISDITSFKDYLKAHSYSDKLSEVVYSEIRQWVVRLVEQGITNRSINRKIAALNTFYNFLLKTETIAVNPLQKHKALKVGKVLQLPFSEKELEQVISQFHVNDFESARNQFIIELFYATGMRRAELINIKVSDIDTARKQIKILGKRNKERYVPLLDSILPTYKTYLQYRSELPLIKDSDYLFLSLKGHKIYEMLVYRIINKYFSRASSKTKCSPHVMRHSFATHLLNKGADLNAIKELLGHTSLAATQVYTHSSIAELKKVHANTHPRNKR